ncbi:CACTA en-spm transposon protein [Cucumis melo var. makuwa]|uniref:CACTA en-spm transposon protein n=1 Tax=Cucumis melo var. makuwa TaxID=1194695 RepID=A0A5A7V312_CUCMM|nr:CACTA en-spm transposon protein [Cucumis melo var. makuwa]TYK27419.1 CACTA en-spm transposon protein [Cucumis melo var. makuwa]
MCMRKTFFVHCLKWADVGREYIEVVKGDLQYNDSGEARANPPNALVGRHEDWYFLCNHYMSRAFQEQSRTNKVARQKQPYNHSNGSKSFLQRQYELAESKGEPINRVNQMLELQSQPTLEGSQPLSEDEICDQVFVQDRNHQALASQVERMPKMIEDFTHAQHGPPHDP